MKKICILAAAMALFFVGCRPSIPNIDSRGSSIVAFGDSITFGVGVSAGSSYPALLSERLGVEVINAGIPGETSLEGFERLPEILELDRTPRLKSDPIHPNEEGYAVLATEVGDLVEELLERREEAR